MSALADYTYAQAREMNARADFQRAQIGALNTGPQADLLRAQASEAGSRAGLNAANSAQVAPDAAARRNDQNAAAGLATAQADNINRKSPLEAIGLTLGNQQAAITNHYLPFTLAAQTTPVGAQPTAPGTPAAPPSAMSAFLANIFRNYRDFSFTDPTPQQQTPDQSGQTPGFEKGGVAGKDKAKPGKTDTIAAKLAPGEAVLNAHAVEHYGTDVIDHMNQMGMLRHAAKKEVMGEAKKAMKKAS